MALTDVGILKYSLWTTVYGPQYTVYGLQSTDRSIQSTDRSIRSMDYSLRTAAYGLWTTVYGQKSILGWNNADQLESSLNHIMVARVNDANIPLHFDLIT
jgi:hypothetical protein